MLEIRRMSWEDFKKKKKNSPKPGGCYFYTPFYCKGLHDVLLNRGQVLCSQSGSLFNSCIKKKRELELWDRSGSEQTFLYCCKHQTDLQIIAQLMHNLELLRNTDVRDHRSANLGLHFKKILKNLFRFSHKAEASNLPWRKLNVSAVARNHRLIVTQPRCY